MLALEALKLPFLKHTVVRVSDFSRKFRGGIRRKAWGIFIQVTRPCKATNFIVNIPQHISCWVILFPWLFPGVSPHRCVTRSSSGGGKCQGKEEGTSLTSNFSQIYMSFSLFLLNKFFYFMMFSFPVWFGDFHSHYFCTMAKEQDASPFSWRVFFLASINSNTPSSPFLSLCSESSKCFNIKPLCMRRIEDGPIIWLERTLSSKWGLQCRGEGRRKEW